MAHIVRPKDEDLTEVGLHEYVGSSIGVIWSRDLMLEVEATDYLRWKASGLWVAKKRSPYASRRPLAQNTIRSIASELINFLDWCESRHVDWRKINFQQVLDSYQGQMQAGKWNMKVKGVPLAASTINQRMSTACDFLCYAYSQGFRGEFETPTTYSRGVDREGKRYSARVGVLRLHPRELRLPTTDELFSWIQGVRKKYGNTAALMVKTAISVGLRPSETVSIRLKQLPDIPNDPGRLTAKIRLKFGTKGHRRRGDSSLEGKHRLVRIPVDLLIDLHSYSRLRRRLAETRFRENNPDTDVPPQLFLTEARGRAFSYDRFYRIWTGSQPLPFAGFSPHLARHIWACYTLRAKIHEHTEMAKGISGPLENIARGMHHTLIQTYVQPQLGHISERTTEAYLNWIVDAMELQEAATDWVDYLNG